MTEEKSSTLSLYKLEYWGVLLALFILIIAGYRNQVILFGIPILVSAYFVCKDMSEIMNFKILSPLIVLFFLGLRITDYPLIHILRDMAYFTSPVFAFAFGYFIQKRIGFNKLLLILILFGSLYALVYFVQVILQFNTLFVEDIERVRYSVGTGMPGPILALVGILFGQKQLKEFKINPLYWVLFVFLNLFAIYYFASRVYYFTLILFILPLLYHSLSNKYKAVGKLLFIFFGVFLCGIILLLISGDNFLAIKIRNSVSEIFIGNFEDYESVIHNWRAYELFEAFKTFMSGSKMEKIFGFGFGKTVYLEFELIMPLLTISEIPIFHNGFAYLLIKTGIIGLALELFFSFMLLVKGFQYSKKDPDLQLYFYLLLASVLSFNFSLLVVNGMFSGESCEIIVLAGYCFAMLHKGSHKQQAS